MRKKGGGGGREAPRCSTCRDESATLRLLLLLGALATVQMRPGPGALATVLVPLQQEQWSVGPCWVPWAVAAPRPRSACPRSAVAGRRATRQSALWEAPPRGLGASADAPLRTPKLARPSRARSETRYSYSPTAIRCTHVLHGINPIFTATLAHTAIALHPDIQYADERGA